MPFLGCLFILLFLIVFIIIGALRNIYEAAFGKSRRKTKNTANTGATGNKYTKRNRKSGDNRVFPDNVGEYIDYEELM